MAIADEADCGEVGDVKQHEPVEVAEAEGANQMRAARQRRKLDDPTQRAWVDLYWVKRRGEEEERRQDDEEEVEVFPLAHVRGDGEASGTEREADKDDGEWC